MLPDTLDALVVLSIPLTLAWVTCATADYFHDRLHRRPARRATVRPGAVGGVIVPVRALRRPPEPPTPAPAGLAPVLDLDTARRVRTVPAPVTVTVTTDREVAA